MARVRKRAITFWRVLSQRVFRLKLWLLFGLLWIVESRLTGNLVRFARAAGEKTTPAVYAFIQSAPFFFTVYLLVVICLFSEAPFAGREQMYVILREGKRRWYLRQLCYVFYLATVAMAGAVAICLLQVAPCLKWSVEWDKILGTLALTSVGTEYGISFGVSNRILAHYSPQEFFLLTVLIGWGVTLFVGVFMFTVSLCFSSRAALLTAVGMVLLCSLQKYYPSWMHYASPVAWIRTTTLGLKYMDHAPGVSYVRIALPVVIGAFAVTGWFVIRKTDLEWTEE